MVARFNRRESDGAGLDAERIARAVILLGTCTMDLPGHAAADFWDAHARAAAGRSTAAQELLREIDAQVSSLPLPAGAVAQLGDLPRRFDERVELVLELDPSDDARRRLAGQAASELGLTLRDELAAALILAAGRSSRPEAELEDAELTMAPLDPALAFHLGAQRSALPPS